MILAANGQCNPGVAVASFEALGEGEGVGEWYTLSNGTCGILVHEGTQS